MKKELFSSNFTIKTKRNYTPKELFQLMKDNLEEKYGTMIIKKEILIGERIFIKGVDGHMVTVSCPAKNCILISQEREKIGFFGMSIGNIADTALQDVKAVLSKEGTKGNRTLMKEIGEEIEKLVNM